jgi:hypothetical protein
MLKVSFLAQHPKEISYPELIEDTFRFFQEKNVFAISDGASESFDSKKWAELIVGKFVENSKVDEEWVYSLIDNYLETVNFKELSWSKQASFERGSFATLLGVQLIEREAYFFTSVGDCMALIVDDDEYTKSFPYKNSIEFDQRPNLISTIKSKNTFFNETTFVNQVKVDSLPNRKILLMSDALASWTLKSIEDKNNYWKRLLYLKDTSELDDLIVDERKHHRMKTDDVTLAIILDDIYELPDS